MKIIITRRCQSAVMAERLRRSPRKRLGFPARVRISLTATLFFLPNETTTELQDVSCSCRLWIDQHVVPVRWFRKLGSNFLFKTRKILFFGFAFLCLSSCSILYIILHFQCKVENSVHTSTAQNIITCNDVSIKPHHRPLMFHPPPRFRNLNHKFTNQHHRFQQMYIRPNPTQMRRQLS